MKINQTEFSSDEFIPGRAMLGKAVNQLISCLSAQLLRIGSAILKLCGHFKTWCGYAKESERTLLSLLPYIMPFS